MKILIVLPPNQPSGGNWTYSGRLQKGLQPHGIEIIRKPLDQVDEADYAAVDLIHSYNAYITGRHIAPIAKRLGKPLVLTMTGTDVNEHLNHPKTRPSMVEVVDYASSIVFLTDQAKANLAEVYPTAESKSHVINLGIDLPSGVGKTRADFGIADDEFVFLLVAGIRPVKRPLDAFEPLAALHEQFANVRFLLAGPKLDDATFTEMEQALSSSDFARYLGSVPFDQISDLYRAADVVMNTSSSEGLSHSLLEAMSLGKPILASNVPGNHDLIQDGENGYLYSNPSEFIDRGRTLITDAKARIHVSQGALRTIEEHFSLARELDAFSKMYSAVYQESQSKLPTH